MRWIVIVGLVGCFDPRYPENVPCSATDPCPGGQQCVGGTCNGAANEDAPLPDDAMRMDAGGDGPASSGGGDTCEDAIEIALDAASIQGSLAGATDNYDPPTDCGTDGIEMIYVIDLPSPMSISTRISSTTFAGQFYTFTSCPPLDFNTCGNIGSMGSTVGVGYPAGKVYLVVERETGTGTDFTIEFP